MFIKTLILGTNKTGITGRLLANVLHGEYNTECRDYHEEFNVIWRWGNFYSELPENFSGHIINKANAIFRNKAETRRRLIDEGITCPTIYTSNTIDLAKFPVIARPVFHMKGRDFNIVNNVEQATYFLRKGYYIQEIINSALEYRIFVFRNKILECNIKELIRIPKRPLHPLIKNWRNGYIFKQKKITEIPPNLLMLCRSGQLHSGLDFCAIDCATTHAGAVYIFELNAAPGLIERKAKKFAARVLHHLGFTLSNIEQTFKGEDDEDEGQFLRPMIERNNNPFRGTNLYNDEDDLTDEEREIRNSEDESDEEPPP